MLSTVAVGKCFWCSEFSDCYRTSFLSFLKMFCVGLLQPATQCVPLGSAEMKRLLFTALFVGPRLRKFWSVGWRWECSVLCLYCCGIFDIFLETETSQRNVSVVLVILSSSNYFMVCPEQTDLHITLWVSRVSSRFALGVSLDISKNFIPLK